MTGLGYVVIFNLTNTGTHIRSHMLSSPCVVYLYKIPYKTQNYSLQPTSHARWGFHSQGGIISRRTAVVSAAVAAIGLLGALAVRVLDTPSRPYNAETNTVGNEYDAWTEVPKYDL